MSEDDNRMDMEVGEESLIYSRENELTEIAQGLLSLQAGQFVDQSLLRNN